MFLFEVTSWRASDDLLASRSAMQPAIARLSRIDGCLGNHFGIVEEDTRRVFSFIPWKSIQHRVAAETHSDYRAYSSVVKRGITGHYSTRLVEFNKDPTSALSASTTEVLKLTIKDGHSWEDVNTLIGYITSHNEREKEVSPPVCWGRTIEDPRVIYVVVGWQSSNAHYTVVTRKFYRLPLATLRAWCKHEMVHTHFDPRMRRIYWPPRQLDTIGNAGFQMAHAKL